MQQDGCFTGPVRGTRGWWQELGKGSKAAAPSKGKRKRGKGRSSGSPIRAELVARVRRELAAGTYDTSEKWNAALDRLLAQLDV